MKTLNVSRTLKLPAEDFIEAATGILGKRKRGKSGLERVIAEELLEAGLPFAWLDFVGLAWGLRSSADGKEKGYSVLVVGGEHGDVPLDARAGKDVARAVIKANVSVVIDLSKSSKGDWRRFVTDFADTLYQENDTSRLVIIDEASEFVPQRPRPENAACFEAVERLVSRGRNKAIGVIIADQRAARVNKDVLSQVDYLICFGVSHPIDLKNLKEWVELQADPGLMGAFTKGLAGLQQREAWAWNPELSIFTQFRVRDFKTLHPDKTHLRKIGMLSKKPVTSDVSEVVTALGAVMEKFKVEKQEQQDAKGLIAQLRKEKAELERRLAAKPDTPPAEVRVERVEVPVFQPAQVEELRGVVRDFGVAAMNVEEQAKRVHATAALLESTVARARAVPSVLPSAFGAQRRVPMPPPSPAIVLQHTSDKAKRGSVLLLGDLTGPQVKILTALARLHKHIGVERPKKAQVAAWAGYSANGGAFNNPIGELRTMGLVDKTSDGTMALTREGHAAAGEPEPLSRDELQEQVLAGLGGPERKLLKALMEHWPGELSKEELAAAAGYEPTGGSFNNPRGRLHTMGLIEYPGNGLSKAADFLFPEA